MQAQQPAAAGRGGGRGGTAVNVFNAADTDKDGSISRDELRAAFTRWLADADTAKSGAITQEQLATALNAAFPQPVFPAGGAGRGPQPTTPKPEDVQNMMAALPDHDY